MIIAPVALTIRNPGCASRSQRPAQQNGQTGNADAGPEEAETRAQKKQSLSATQLLDQKISITDQQIDARLYELYGLTGEEARIVEPA